MEVTICKADPLGAGEVQDGIINIVNKLPELSNQELNDFYENQAELIFRVLDESLPQGTLSKLLILMLKNAENLYRGT